MVCFMSIAVCFAVLYMQGAASELAKRLMKTASKVMDYLSMDDSIDGDDHNSFYQSTMHACFNLGFEVRKYVFCQKLRTVKLKFIVKNIHYLQGNWVHVLNC